MPGSWRREQGRAYAILRRAKGFGTQQALADELGSHQPTISQWETGTRPLDHALVDPVLAVGDEQLDDDILFALAYISDVDGELRLVEPIAVFSSPDDADQAGQRSATGSAATVAVPVWRSFLNEERA